MSLGGQPAARTGRSRLAILLLFAAAMGWLEGVVVVYIRGLFGMAHGPTVPPPEEVTRQFGRLPWLLPTEQTRELATIIMIATVAWLSARRLVGRLGAFLIVFGVWDIVYYVSLYALLRWPPGLRSMDVLFLIPPGPWWNQPVWVPLVIASAMTVVGMRLFAKDPG